MNTITPARAQRKRFKTRVHRAASVRETTVLLFGNITDPEVQESKRRAEISGRKTELVARPSFDTGVGPCGKHVCSCKEVCKLEYAKSIGAYPGDQGATMGHSF